jgi:hypothetical protein
MLNPITSASTPPLTAGDPPVGGKAAAAPVATPQTGGPVAKPRITFLPTLASDQVPGTSPAAKGTIPATSPQMAVLTKAPPPGSVLQLDGADGPNTLSETIRQLLRNGADPSNPPGSNWTNRNDIRLVLPIMTGTDGLVSSSLETMPGRNMSWATVQVGSSKADTKLNFDGVNGGIRLGIGGPLHNPYGFNGQQVPMGQLASLEWAEFRVGAEGLVATGRIVDGKVAITSFDVTGGYFKAKLDDVGGWAKNHLGIAIPVGILAAGGAAFAASAIARKTGTDLAVPLGVPVYNKNGFVVSPLVRPIFGKDQFMKFGGAEVNVGYTQAGKYSLNVMPGYNNDPMLGPRGVTIGGRANVALPYNGVAGAEVRYNPQGGVSAFVGVAFTF